MTVMKPERATSLTPPTSAPPGGREVESDLVDVSALSLADLDELGDGDTALAAAIRRILDDQDGPVSGFTSRI